MKVDERLYFIALIPEGEVYTDVMNWKQHFEKEYHSKASLNSDPHITLHMPFRWRDKKRDALFNCLETLATNNAPFDLKVEGFAAFPPRTIYLDVEEKREILELQHQVKESFRRDLKLLNANYKDHAFKPHITLAYKDLRKNEFQRAWAEFGNKEYRSSFEVKHISLLKHNSKRWEIDKRFDLKGGL